MATITRSHPATVIDASLVADAADPQALEREIAQEQQKLLRVSMAQTGARIEHLATELRMLPWNCARSLRDARQALGAARAALAEAQQQADTARCRLQCATDELAAAEARLSPATPERRGRGLGLLMRRRRRHDGALLDLRMDHALASEHLQAALDRQQQARATVQVQQQMLNDVLAQRRRQRSILVGELEALERRLQREQAQFRECSALAAGAVAPASTEGEDSMAPA